MTSKSKLVTLSVLAFCMCSNAIANIQIGFSFQPELLEGTDEQQLVGSTWTFLIDVSETEYSDYGSGIPYVIPDSVTLTVVGSGNSANNGNFSLIQNAPENFALIPTNGTYAYPLTTDDFGADFEFGDAVSVSSFNAVGSPVGGTPSVGSSVLAEHFNGIELSVALEFFTTNNPFGLPTYGIPSGTIVTAEVIPEPSAFIIPLTAIVFLLVRRRRLS